MQRGSLVWFSLALFAAAAIAAESEVWWRDSIMYHVYMRSFADSDGDGNGDLRGVMDRVDYLKDIGVDIVYLSPIFESPWEDLGYDISDFKKIEPMFGTLTDLLNLAKKVHQRGMKLILDLVINHTSEKHEWFREEVKRSPSPNDRFFWREPIGWNGSQPIPPNNWRSAFGGGAWEWVEHRGQFYLHHFGKYQPELDLTKEVNLEAIKDMMRFWLDLGVDGFRVDAVPFLIEDPQLRSEPLTDSCPVDDGTRGCLEHIYTENQDESYEFLEHLDRLVREEYPGRYLFLEAYAPDDKLMRYYNNVSTPFNFAFVRKFLRDSDASKLKEIVDTYVKIVPKGQPLNWAAGNHDNGRVASRFGPELVDGINALLLLLPGVAVTYLGEEIGMEDLHLRPEEQTGSHRDEERTPFQWDDTKNAGFSKGKSWLPVNPNYWRLNAKAQRNSRRSHLSVYKELKELRKRFAGSNHLATVAPSKWIFGFKRWTDNDDVSYYVLMNLGNREEELDLRSVFPGVARVLKVAVASLNSALNKGWRVRPGAGKLRLRPMEMLVLYG